MRRSDAEARSIDSYLRLNKIQEGSFGVVYRARDTETGEIVALKKIKMEREKEGFPITAMRELRLLKRCRHPNIVAVHEIAVGHSADSIWIVMEFVEHDLRELQERMQSAFMIGEVKALMVQLLAGVAHLHEVRCLRPSSCALLVSFVLPFLCV